MRKSIFLHACYYIPANNPSHRLSTITAADQILVLHAGRVVEAGNHQELLALNGRYYNMWRKQIRAEQAAEQASRAVAKANALRKAALARPGSSGNEGSPSEDVSESETDTHSSTGEMGLNIIVGSLTRSTEPHVLGTSVGGSNNETLVDNEAHEDDGLHRNLGQPTEGQPFNTPHSLEHDSSSDDNMAARPRRHSERRSPH